jgi:hypothetical protein
MNTLEHKNCEFEIDSLLRLQPEELTEQWRDVFKLRRRVDKDKELQPQHQTYASYNNLLYIYYICMFDAFYGQPLF